VLRNVKPIPERHIYYNYIYGIIISLGGPPYQQHLK
jgi:hypothetical protein